MVCAFMCVRVIRVIEETRIQNYDSRHDDSVIRSNVEEYNFKYISRQS